MIFNDFPQSLPFLCVSGVLKSLFGCFHLLFFCLFSFLQLKKIFNNFNKTSVTHCINWTAYQTKQTGYTTLLGRSASLYILLKKKKKKLLQLMTKNKVCNCPNTSFDFWKHVYCKCICKWICIYVYVCMCSYSLSTQSYLPLVDKTHQKSDSFFKVLVWKLYGTPTREWVKLWPLLPCLW